MTAAVLLALGSALLHAGWNLIVKTGRDPLISIWAVFATSTLVAVPVLVVAGWPSIETWPYLAGSSVLQVLYAFSLSAAYRDSELSVAYPVARGIAPMLVSIVAVFTLEDVLSPTALLGVALMSASLVVIARKSGSRRGIGWAVLTGVVISGYTLIDAAGVRRGDESIRYVAALFVVSAVLITAAVLVVRRPAAVLEQVRGPAPSMAASGLLSIGAYGLVMTAARLGPIGLVAALRETSVVFGALAGWVVLGERLGRRRTIAAVGVALGAALLLTA